MKIQHSFAVLAYKDSPYLKACLDSLKAQSIESYVFISTSTPSSFLTNIAKEYNVEIFISNSGKGIANDWNFALSQVKTKYVTLAHQDDIYESGYTSHCINQLSKFDDALFCFTDYSEIIDGKKRNYSIMLAIKQLIIRIFMPFKNYIQQIWWKKRLLSFGCPIAAPSVMYNMNNLLGFRFDSNFTVNLDWNSWFKMANMNGKFIYINKRLIGHRLHAASATTNSLANNIRKEEDYRMFLCFWPRFMVKIILKFYGLSYKLN